MLYIICVTFYLFMFMTLDSGIIIRKSGSHISVNMAFFPYFCSINLIF